MIAGMRHVGIVVKDAETSLRFYRDLLGLRVVRDGVEADDHIAEITGLPGVRLRIVKLSVDGGCGIELLQFLSHPAEGRAERHIAELGRAHIALTVDDIDGEFARLVERGVAFNSAPCNSPDGAARYAYCYDPDGVIIELVEEL